MSPFLDSSGIFDLSPLLENEDDQDAYFDSFLKACEIDAVVQDLTLNNWYADDECMKEMLNPDLQRKWEDYPNTEHATRFNINNSRTRIWELTKTEVAHIRSNLNILLAQANDPDLSGDYNSSVQERIMFTLIGPQSDFGRAFMHELGIPEKEYLEFLGTIAVMSAYDISSAQLYGKYSLLKDAACMDQQKFLSLFEKLATSKKVSSTEIRTNRSPKPIWQTLEGVVNDVCHSVSISSSNGDGRKGKTSIAIDDDKIHMNLSNSGSDDLFNLKYTTHVRDNRKGIIAHTAVSTGANVPLGISFEKKGDTTMSCIERLLWTMFGITGVLELEGVEIHSDRGYFTPSLVFGLLMAFGADVS